MFKLLKLRGKILFTLSVRIIIGLLFAMQLEGNFLHEFKDIIMYDDSILATYYNFR